MCIIRYNIEGASGLCQSIICMNYKEMHRMLVRLIEVYNKRTYASSGSGKTEEFSLREVLVNPEHVVCIRENNSLKTRLLET